MKISCLHIAATHKWFFNSILVFWSDSTNFFYQTLRTKPYAAPWTVVSFSRRSALIHIYYITTVFDNIWIIQCAKSSSTLLSWMEHLRHWIQRYERKIQSWKLAHLPFLSFWSFDASHSLAFLFLGWLKRLRTTKHYNSLKSPCCQ